MPRAANARRIVHRLAPPLIEASAVTSASRACSIVGLHGVFFMPWTTMRSSAAAPIAVRIVHSVAAHSSPTACTPFRFPERTSLYVNGELAIDARRMPVVLLPVTYAPTIGSLRNDEPKKSLQPSPMPPDCRPRRQVVDPPPTRRFDRPCAYSW